MPVYEKCSKGFYSLKISIKIVKHKADYSADSAYCGLFVERNSHDKHGTTVMLMIKAV